MFLSNIFIVGFQKCGSSSLFHLLCEHPEITGTSPKETFFLVDQCYDNFNSEINVKNPFSSWDRFFSNSTNTKYLLEGTVSNFYQDTAKNYIYSLKKKKVIFIIRNPIKRFISNYKYYYGKINGIQSGISIEKYFQQVLQGYYSRECLKYSLEHGKYLKYLSEWSNLIDKGDIHVLSFEHLMKEPSKEANKVFRFLNLDEMKNIYLPHLNESKSPNFPNLQKNLVQLIGGTILSNKITKNIYNRFLNRKKVEINLSENLENELHNYYKDEFKELREYFI